MSGILFNSSGYDESNSVNNIITRCSFFYFNVLGDLSYSDCVGRLWDSYGEMIEPLSSQIPWMVSPGNHEIEHIFVNKTNPAGEKDICKLIDFFGL